MTIVKVIEIIFGDEDDPTGEMAKFIEANGYQNTFDGEGEDRIEGNRYQLPEAFFNLLVKKFNICDKDGLVSL